MDVKNIQVRDYKWTSTNIIKYITDENLEGYFYSWGEFSVPTSYTKCNGNSLAIRKCTITSQIFIECDFRGIDASDSIFIDCLFLNCLFNNANFHKANFIGTAIVNDNDYCHGEKLSAGMSQTKFKSSAQNNSVLSNLKLDGCSFRHTIFECTIFDKVSIEYTSFEDAYFNNCIIDSLDLRSSACRGIIINKCQIKKYVSSLEKTLGAIGALQTLESCENIELYVNSHKIDNLNKLVKKLNDVSQNFLLEGKLFEFVNIMNYLYMRTEEFSQTFDLSLEHTQKLIVQKGLINGYSVSEKGRFLYKMINFAYETISNNGCRINLDDILYSLKLMYFLNIYEYSLLRFLLDIYRNEILTRHNDYADFLVVSQINHYFQEIGNRIKSNKYRITFHNETASWQSSADRNNFYEFCKQFITLTTENSDFKLVSMHEGSIDAIFESLFNIENILIVASVLGSSFQYKDGKISFAINPSRGIKSYAEFIKLILSIMPLLGDKKPTQTKFEDISMKAKKVFERLKEYITRNVINGNLEQNNAVNEIEETITETRVIKQRGENSIITETIVKKRKIIQH